jgi:hypothetical protein
LSDTAQAKIDGLERLLLNFIKSHQPAVAQSDTPPDSMHDEINQYPNIAQILVDDAKTDRQEPTAGMGQLSPRLAGSKPTININADHKQSQAVDVAHWALLLNEVNSTSNLPQSI